MSSASESPDPNNPWDDKTSKKFENKQPGEYLDPCQEAASRSLKCLHRNGGDREMCSDYFQAYRDCKKKWMDDRRAMKLKEGKSWFAR